MKRKTLISVIGAGLTVAAAGVLLPSTAIGAQDNNTVDRATTDSFGRLADAVLNERTAALLDGRRVTRPGDLHDKKVRVASGLARTETSGLSSLRDRKKVLEQLGEVYSNAETKVSTDGVRIKGRTATVQVTETTVLTYKKVRGDEPTTTGFQAHHELTFTRGSKGSWELSTIRAKDEGPRAVNQPVTAPAPATDGDGYPKATPAAITWPARPAPKTQKAGGYDYKAMAAYAEKYWSRYNPAYPSFNKGGGDCTNFISQALKAGGWKDAPGSESDYTKWWYNSSNRSLSTSWVGANEWSWFTLSQKRATNLQNVYQMDVGDILQMDFDRDGSKDHSMIVTYRSRMGVPYVTYHSTNTFRKSVASIIASNPDAVYYAYRT
ncbi:MULTISPECIES: amidase domain-containing protein [Streptomyces]|uniref:Putative amidase domain-containing protein n=1 Tax=Streptomyces luteosporeus TaxID=173856 RepID=A0ABN3TW52_9ACTN